MMYKVKSCLSLSSYAVFGLLLQISYAHAADKKDENSFIGDAAGEVAPTLPQGTKTATTGTSTEVEYLGIKVKYAKLFLMKGGQPIPNQEKSFVGNDLKNFVALLNSKLEPTLSVANYLNPKDLSAMLVLGSNRDIVTKSYQELIHTVEARVQMEWYQRSRDYTVAFTLLHDDAAKRDKDIINRVMNRTGIRKITPTLLWNSRLGSKKQ